MFELNKDTSRDDIELLLTWQEYTFVKVYFDMSSKSIEKYSN